MNTHTRSRLFRPTLAWTAIAAAAVAVLLALGSSQPVRAGVPALTANPNPVGFLCDATSANSKPVTLSYNLNGEPKARLQVTKAGAATSYIDTEVATQTGTQPLTVVSGENQTAVLKHATSGAIYTTLQITTTKDCSVTPTLSPSEPSPLQIPCGTSTKTINLNYNLGSFEKGQIQVAQAGMPVVGFPKDVTAPPQTGSVALTVTYGKVYDVVFKHPTLGTVFASFSVTTRARDCLFKDVQVSPHGTYAEFQWFTNTPATVTIEVGTSAPVNGVFTTIVGSVSQTNVYAMQNLGPMPIYGLQPNTTYHYAATATAQDGEKAVRTGTFKTWTRTVAVTFQKIQMFNDSDALSGCDCIFWLRVNNGAAVQYLDSTQGVTDGEDLFPNKLITVLNAPDSLSLQVQGWDKDYSLGIFEVNACGIGPSFTTNSVGGDCASEWATASKTVSALPQSPGVEAYTQTFSMKTASGLPSFSVSGKYVVSYAP